MAKFQRASKGGQPAISTAALPDIVFMLLFFFMVTTVMKETSMMVRVDVPKATEVKKLEKKSAISYIYIGKPFDQFQSLYGSKPRIQLNDAFAEVDQIREWVTNERNKMDEVKQKQMTVSLKVDGTVTMGIVTETKTELRKASALKINYSSKKVESY